MARCDAAELNQRIPPRMPRSLAILGLAALIGAAGVAPAVAARVTDAIVVAPVTAPAPLRMAQYYAPPPVYRPPPRRRCWTEMRRVVRYDRWGRPVVRMVPQTVCAGRRW